MDGIAVNRCQANLFVIQEYCLGHNRSRSDNVPVGQDQAAFRVDDESCRLAGGVPAGIESAGAVNADGDHAGRYSFQRSDPFRLLCQHRNCKRQSR